MFIPSLTLVLCIFAPVVALFLTARKLAPHIPYAFASLPLLLASALCVADDLPVFVNTSSLKNGTIEAKLNYLLPLSGGLMLMTCAALVLLQHKKSLLFYPAFTRALAAPLALFSAATVPLVFATPYLFGLFKWSLALPQIKVLGVVGVVCMSLATIALVGFLVQLLLSALKALRGQRSAR